MEPLKVIDLFAGIAGFSLGLHRAGGFQTVRFCEIDPFCQRVLAKHWPDIPCHDDITTMEFKEGEADVITAGWPCQDISYAGHGAGLAGERSGLWSEVIRAIRVVRPKFVLLENSSALLDRGMGEVLGDLSESGYDAEWSVVSACSLGFPHMRERVLIVAYPSVERRQQCWRIELDQVRQAARDVHLWFRQPEPVRVVNGIPNRSHRNRTLGNAIVPQVVEIIGRSILQEAK